MHAARAGTRGGPVTVEIVRGRAGAVARIHLKGGTVALVDLGDLPRIVPYRWYANSSDGR